jgi:hypothetical protein
MRLVGVLDVDEALGVAEIRALDHVGADERRHDHRVLERHGPAVGEDDLAGRDLRGRHVEDAVDLLALEEHAEQLLAAGQPADPEVPRERLGAHVAQRDLELVLLELVGHVEDELVGGAEAGGALRGGYDHRARVVEEAGPAFGGADGPVEVGDPVRVAARP